MEWVDEDEGDGRVTGVGVARLWIMGAQVTGLDRQTIKMRGW